MYYLVICVTIAIAGGVAHGFALPPSARFTIDSTRPTVTNKSLPPNYLKCTDLNVTYLSHVDKNFLQSSTYFVASTVPNPSNLPTPQVQQNISDNISCYQATFDPPSTPSFTEKDDIIFKHTINAKDFPPGTKIVDGDEAIISYTIFPSKEDDPNYGHWILQVTKSNGETFAIDVYIVAFDRNAGNWLWYSCFKPADSTEQQSQWGVMSKGSGSLSMSQKSTYASMAQKAYVPNSQDHLFDFPQDGC